LKKFLIIVFSLKNFFLASGRGFGLISSLEDGFVMMKLVSKTKAGLAWYSNTTTVKPRITGKRLTPKDLYVEGIDYL